MSKEAKTRERAWVLGKYPSSSTTFHTRLASWGSTVGTRLMARDTVAVETLARFAISRISIGAGTDRFGRHLTTNWVHDFRPAQKTGEPHPRLARINKPRTPASERNPRAQLNLSPAQGRVDCAKGSDISHIVCCSSFRRPCLHCAIWP